MMETNAKTLSEVLKVKQAAAPAVAAPVAEAGVDPASLLQQGGNFLGDITNFMDKANQLLNNPLIQRMIESGAEKKEQRMYPNEVVVQAQQGAPAPVIMPPVLPSEQGKTANEIQGVPAPTLVAEITPEERTKKAAIIVEYFKAFTKSIADSHPEATVAQLHAELETGGQRVAQQIEAFL